jgi:hypothetical protein
MAVMFVGTAASGATISLCGYLIPAGRNVAYPGAYLKPYRRE